VNNHVVNLHRSFQNFGIQSHLVGPHSGCRDSKDESVTFVGSAFPVPTKGSVARVSLSLWQNPRVKQIIKQRAFDVIHVHEPFSSIVTLSALSAHIPENAIKVATFHTFEGSNLYRLVTSKLLSRYSSELDGSIAVSKPAKDFINTHIPGNYNIIPNGVNVDDFENAEPIKNLQNKVNLLYVGRLEKRKGLIHLLRAYHQLKADHADLRLIVVGGGSLGKDEKRFLKENHLEDVMFVGEVTEQEKFNYFKTADIFCSPSIGQESFGIVLLEAMAAGVPVVASDIAGYASVINDKRNGLLFEVENVESLYKVLSGLIGNNELKGELATNASAFVKEFDWAEVSQKILNFYFNVSLHNRLHVNDALRKVFVPI